MKTPDQIYRHISLCRFSDEDWRRVKAYCQENEVRVRKAAFPITDSTYDQFIDWLGNGFGSGDLVRYGNIVGILGDSVPGLTFMPAFLDPEGKLSLRDLNVREPERLESLDEISSEEWRKQFFDSGHDYDIKSGAVLKIPKLKHGCFYKFSDCTPTNFKMGMFDEYGEDEYKFLAYSDNGKIHTDYSVPINNTPLRLATERDIVRFNNQIDRASLIFNENTGKYMKRPPRNKSNYWYVDDLFQVCVGKKSDKKIRLERWLVGNYFSDPLEANLFVEKLKKLREEWH